MYNVLSTVSKWTLWWDCDYCKSDFNSTCAFVRQVRRFGSQYMLRPYSIITGATATSCCWIPPHSDDTVTSDISPQTSPGSGAGQEISSHASSPIRFPWLLSDESHHGFIMKVITVQGFCSLTSMYLHNPMYPRLYIWQPSECLSFSLRDTVNILWSTTFMASEVILDWGGASCWVNKPQGSFHFISISFSWTGTLKQPYVIFWSKLVDCWVSQLQ